MDDQMDDQAHDAQSLEVLETRSDLTNAYEEHFCGYSNSDSEPDNMDNEEPDDVRRETSEEPPFKELEIDLDWVNQEEEEEVSCIQDSTGFGNRFEKAEMFA